MAIHNRLGAVAGSATDEVQRCIDRNRFIRAAGKDRTVQSATVEVAASRKCIATTSPNGMPSRTVRPSTSLYLWRRSISSVLLKPWVRAFRMLTGIPDNRVDPVTPSCLALASGDRGSTTPPASQTACAASTLSQRTRMRPVAGRFERSCAASSVAAMRTIPVWGRNNVGKGGRRVSQPPLTRQPKNFFDQPGRCQCAGPEVVIRIRDDAVEQ